jgi:protein tyrosine phosphatase
MKERPAPAPRPPSYVNASDIKVAYPRPYLAEEADVDQYVNELRKTLMAEIAAGKKVIV